MEIYGELFRINIEPAAINHRNILALFPPVLITGCRMLCAEGCRKASRMT